MLGAQFALAVPLLNCDNVGADGGGGGLLACGHVAAPAVGPQTLMVGNQFEEGVGLIHASIVNGLRPTGKLAASPSDAK